MRLWHYKLIKYLPRQQLLGQWRELNSIFAKEDKHILINYVYEYDKEDLCAYTNSIIDEMEKRSYKVNVERFENYMQKDIVDSDCWANVRSCKLYYVFTNHHNERSFWRLNSYSRTPFAL